MQRRLESLMMTGAQTNAATVSHNDTRPGVPPDWSAITHEVLCPLCEYHLRGLTMPRCPECGYRFDWPEVLDPQRAPHPWLFEHHPAQNAWSYFRTMRGTWRPRRFWTSLHPTQPSRPRRLILYWCLGLVLIPVLVPPLVLYPFRLDAASMAARRANELATIQRNGRRQQQIIASYGSVQAYLDRYFASPSTWALARKYVVVGPGSLRWWRGTAWGLAPIVVLVLLAWPWLTVGALLIFQISIRRARIKAVHVLRCVLYSFDIPSCALILLAGIGVAWWACAWLPLSYWYRGSADPYFDSMCLFVAAWLAVGTYRLYIAYRRYLRFHQPLATVIVSQILVFMGCLAAVQLYDPRVGYMLFQSLHLLPRLR